MAVANRTHGEFELCQALRQLADVDDLKRDLWAMGGSVLRVWKDEVFFNCAYDVDAVSKAIRAAQQAEGELAERFLQEHDAENPYQTCPA